MGKAAASPSMRPPRSTPPPPPPQTPHHHNTTTPQRASHAARLAAEARLAELSELHIFAEVAPIVAALRARDCGPALAWCAEHRGRLRKARSSLEFRLRLQEFLELVRQVRWGPGGGGGVARSKWLLESGAGDAWRCERCAQAAADTCTRVQVTPSPCPARPHVLTHTHATQGARLAAVAYARAHLAPLAQQPASAHHLPELQRALATLAAGPATKVPRYRALFADTAWTGLLEQFHREMYRLQGLAPASALAVHLQVCCACADCARVCVCVCARCVCVCVLRVCVCVCAACVCVCVCVCADCLCVGCVCLCVCAPALQHCGCASCVPVLS
jgi:hypothetical protein